MSLLGQHCLRNIADRSQSHPHTQLSRLLEIQFCSQLPYTQQEHQGPEKARSGAGLAGEKFVWAPDSSCHSLDLFELELTTEGIKKGSLLATINQSWNSLFLLRFIYLLT